MIYMENHDVCVKAGQAKVKYYNNSLFRYFIASILAGAFVGFGIALIMSIGGRFNMVDGLGPLGPVFMGVSFGIALSLVVMAGAELFTGNNMLLVTSGLAGKTTWSDLGKIWVVSYIGNFIGSIIIAVLLWQSGLLAGPAGVMSVAITEVKTSASFFELLCRGILANTLVCLAVLMALRMKSESGKLIMIWWCLFGFIAPLYEHSIANMTVLTMGYLTPDSPYDLSIFITNLIPSTLGNIIGGAGLGAIVYYLGNKPFGVENEQK
ncbi:MAG: formate/nitrite transporter family protein [Bacilli bacterium]